MTLKVTKVIAVPISAQGSSGLCWDSGQLCSSCVEAQSSSGSGSCQAISNVGNAKNAP